MNKVDLDTAVNKGDLVTIMNNVDLDTVVNKGDLVTVMNKGDLDTVMNKGDTGSTVWEVSALDADGDEGDTVAELSDALTSTAHLLTAELHRAILAVWGAVPRRLAHRAESALQARPGDLWVLAGPLLLPPVHAVALPRAPQGHTLAALGAILVPPLSAGRQVLALDAVPGNLWLLSNIFIECCTDETSAAVSCVEAFTSRTGTCFVTL